MQRENFRHSSIFFLQYTVNVPCVSCDDKPLELCLMVGKKMQADAIDFEFPNHNTHHGYIKLSVYFILF